MLRTPTIELDEDFEHFGAVTKTTVDPSTGKRLIRGVASGVLEDRDGERVSRRAIAKMAAQPTADGAIKVTSTHQQDWATEFGDVAKLTHDPKHDELIVDCELPPEGVDPIADKAWRAMTVEGRQLGFSIGGKLRKGYFELVDTAKGPGGRPKRRKVLDDILLRHVALTSKPSYRQSFAETVSKTFTGHDPAADTDEAFSIDEAADVELSDAARISKALDAAPDVAKAKAPAKAPADAGDPDDDDGENPAADQPTDAPPAGTGATAPAGDTPSADDNPADSDAADAADLPMAKRHLACPNCGHEFAADLPDDQFGSTPDDPKGDADTAKSTPEETTVSKHDETLAKIRDLVTADDTVAKTAPEPDPVAKTEEEPSDVLKMVAASHRHADERIDGLEEQVGKGFEKLVDVVKDLRTQIAALSPGRRSVARVLPAGHEVEKTATDSDDVAKRIAETDDPVEAMRLQNQVERGVR